MKPLYAYANEYQKVIDLIEDCDEITPELMDMLESVSTESKDKIKNVAAYIKNLEAMSKSIDDAITEMNLRQFKVETKIENMKNYLKHNMESMQLKEVCTPEFDVKIRYNRYALCIEDPSMLPEEYFKEHISKSIDKQQISKDLKNDILISGAKFMTTSTVNIK
jgi:hypothetical protein